MADPVGVPAEFTDALRGITPFFDKLATMIETVVPTISSMVPAVGTFVEALSASQPEILALMEAAKVVAPVVQQMASSISSTLGPAVQQLAASLAGDLTPILKQLADIVGSVLKPIVDSLGTALKGLSVVLAAVAVAINPLGAVSDQLKKVIGAVSNAVKSVVSALTTAGSAVLAALGKMAGGLASVAHSFYSAFKAAVLEPLGNAVRSLASSVAGAVRQFVAASFSMSGTSDLLRTLGGALGNFVGGLTSGVQAVASAVTPFVQALNPNLMYALNYAFRGLQATIGVALVPVVQVLASTIRQMAGALLPAMQPLGEVLGKFANVIGGFVVNSMQRFAQNLIDMKPILDGLVDGFRVLMGLWEPIRAVVFAFVDSLVNKIKSMFGGQGENKDMLSRFRDALHTAAAAVVRFSAMMARFFGFGDFIENLKNQLTRLAEPVKTNGMAPAPSEVGFKTFEDIQKTMAQAAFAAQGGAAQAGDDKSEREWLQELAASLDEMKNGTRLEDVVSDAKRAVLDAIQSVEAEVPKKLEGIYNDLEKTISGKLRRYWNDGVVFVKELPGRIARKLNPFYHSQD